MKRSTEKGGTGEAGERMNGHGGEMEHEEKGEEGAFCVCALR